MPTIPRARFRGRLQVALAVAQEQCARSRPTDALMSSVTVGGVPAAARGRPKRPVTATMFQLQPTSDETQTRRFAATIKLSPAIMKAIQGGDPGVLLQLQMGAKENDVQFIVNGESHKLRCAKDDPSKVDVYESHVHDDDDSSAEQPLFDPYTNLLYPAADIAIQNKYYVPKQLNEDTKQLVAKKSAEAEKEFRPSKTMRADASSFGSIVSPVAAVSSAPPAKRKYTKRKDAAAPNPEADLSATKKKKTPDAALPSPTPFLSPGSAHMPNSTSASPSASPLNPITSPPIHSPTASKPLAKPRLLRSPSTAAMPSSLTACEKLRARIVHFLAAQPLGLPMSTLRVRLGVPPEDMKSTLGVVATYESPGYYNLRPELYTELQIESWKDYNDDDRRRVVGKMTRLGLEVDERLREAYGSTLDPSAQLDTPEPLAPSPDATASAIVAATASPASPCPPASRAAAILAPLLSRPFPPLPDLSSLPDEVPSSMLVVADRDDDPFCESPPLVPAPPTVISDYVQYLTMHTDFLHKHRAYKMIGAWLVFTADRMSAIRTAHLSEPDASVKAAIKQQLAQLYTEKIQLKESVERKQRILHVMLRSFKQSLQTYSSQHHLYTMQTIKEE